MFVLFRNKRAHPLPKKEIRPSVRIGIDIAVNIIPFETEMHRPFVFTASIELNRAPSSTTAQSTLPNYSSLSDGLSRTNIPKTDQRLNLTKNPSKQEQPSLSAIMRYFVRDRRFFGEDLSARGSVLTSEPLAGAGAAVEALTKCENALFWFSVAAFCEAASGGRYGRRRKWPACVRHFWESRDAIRPIGVV